MKVINSVNFREMKAVKINNPFPITEKRVLRRIWKMAGKPCLITWYCALHFGRNDRRFMGQAGRTRYFARSATRVRSARRGKEKNKALFFSFPRLALRTRVALRAKYRVRPAWPIKRLSLRPKWRAQYHVIKHGFPAIFHILRSTRFSVMGNGLFILTAFISLKLTELMTFIF